MERPAELRVDVGSGGPDGYAVLRLSGELVVNNRRVVREALERVIRETDEVPRIALECSSLEYLDTAGLALLLDLSRRCQRLGGGVAIVALPSRFNEMMEKLHLPEHLDLFDSMEAARRDRP